MVHIIILLPNWNPRGKRLLQHVAIKVQVIFFIEILTDNNDNNYYDGST